MVTTMVMVMMMMVYIWRIKGIYIMLYVEARAHLSFCPTKLYSVNANMQNHDLNDRKV